MRDRASDAADEQDDVDEEFERIVRSEWLGRSA